MATNRIAPYGYVFLGPDNQWHWDDKESSHPSITEQRPATAVEAGLVATYRTLLKDMMSK